MRIMGIDPGKSGGIAVLSDEWQLVMPMPETEADIKEVIKQELDSAKEKEQFLRCYLEAVHAMPGQGVVSMFKFGMNYGIIRGILSALGISFETVSPAKWQRALGCLSKGDKNVTKRKAQELFPLLKITHKTADALLIAEYGRRMFNTQENKPAKNTDALLKKLGYYTAIFGSEDPNPEGSKI